MQKSKLLLAATALAASSSAVSVELSTDGRGQVILLPLVTADTFERSELVIRNSSSTEGKAVRVVARDPFAGRPTASINVYLAPNDGWRVAIDAFEGAGTGVRARFAPWVDRSCTFPAPGALPDGLVFSDEQLDAATAPLDAGNRLGSASIEVYEMGTIDPALARDCDEIAERWAPAGLWESDPDADVTAPTGTLEASVSLVSRFPARAFQYPGVALDAFRDAPLHRASSDRSPHLGDVQPAMSTTFRRVNLAHRTIRVQVDLSWENYPVNAVNAVLMARSASGEYVSNSASRSDRAGNGEAAALVYFPTRAFHVDPSGFYLPAGTTANLGPFAGSDELDASVATGEGDRFAVGAPPGLQDCNRLSASLVSVAIQDSASFGGRCDRQTAQLFVTDERDSGQLMFAFDGEIVSDDGAVFTGSPVLPLLFQARTESGVGTDRFATGGWASYMSTDRQADP